MSRYSFEQSNQQITSIFRSIGCWRRRWSDYNIGPRLQRRQCEFILSVKVWNILKIQNHVLVTTQTKYPIMEMASDVFLSTMDRILAVLSPTKLTYYAVNFGKFLKKLVGHPTALYYFSQSRWHSCYSRWNLLSFVHNFCVEYVCNPNRRLSIADSCSVDRL